MAKYIVTIIRYAQCVLRRAIRENPKLQEIFENFFIIKNKNKIKTYLQIIIYAVPSPVWAGGAWFGHCILCFQVSSYFILVFYNNKIFKHFLSFEFSSNTYEARTRKTKKYIVSTDFGKPKNATFSAMLGREASI